MANRPMFITYALEHRYIAAYNHLNRHLDVCFARRTRERIVKSPGMNADDDTTVSQCLVTLSPRDLACAKRAYRSVRAEYRRRGKLKPTARVPITFRLFMEAAIGDYYLHGCGHDFDCCGCAHGGGVARQLSPRRYAVSIHSAPNY
ncbi:hypothetical protein ACM75Z_30510 [Pseudomonas aeruginosa]